MASTSKFFTSYSSHNIHRPSWSTRLLFCRSGGEVPETRIERSTDSDHTDYRPPATLALQAATSLGYRSNKLSYTCLGASGYMPQFARSVKPSKQQSPLQVDFARSSKAFIQVCTNPATAELRKDIIQVLLPLVPSHRSGNTRSQAPHWEVYTSQASPGCTGQPHPPKTRKKLAAVSAAHPCIPRLDKYHI